MPDTFISYYPDPVRFGDVKKGKMFEKLPDLLADFLIAHGEALWGGGLLVSLSPDNWDEILEEWLDEPGKASVFMRTAFGRLFFWQEGEIWYLNPHSGKVGKVIKDPQAFLDKFCLDANIREKAFMEPLFKKSVKKLGAPEPDEMYGFVPALALGGAPELRYVKRVPVREHLSLLAGLKQ